MLFPKLIYIYRLSVKETSFSIHGDMSCYHGSILNKLKKIILSPTLQFVILGGAITGASENP